MEEKLVNEYTSLGCAMGLKWVADVNDDISAQQQSVLVPVQCVPANAGSLRYAQNKPNLHVSPLQICVVRMQNASTICLLAPLRAERPLSSTLAVMDCYKETSVVVFTKASPSARRRAKATAT
jgi:hypothetical protein